MGKPTICISENEDADQLRSNREADQRLCFRNSDSTIPLLLKSEISSFYLFAVLEQVGLCQTCSETTLLVFPRGCSFTEFTLCIKLVSDKQIKITDKLYSDWLDAKPDLASIFLNQSKLLLVGHA